MLTNVREGEARAAHPRFPESFGFSGAGPLLVLRPGNFVPGGWAAVLVSRADMTRCIGLAVLRVVVLAGSAACTAPVGSKLDVPADAAATCAGHCEEIGMRLSAVAIMADNVGCVCEPRSGAVSPSAARETATSAAGMATILMQQQAADRARQAQRQRVVPNR